MSSKKYITAFYTQLDNFMDGLSEQFPEETSIKVYQKTVHLVRTGNPTTFIRHFHDYISPYKKKIKSKDEEFFLNEVDPSEYNNETVLMESLKITKIWKSGRLSNISKKSIFEYFEVLLQLSELCVQNKKNN